MVEFTSLSYILVVFETFVAASAVIGNVFIIVIFFRDEKLQKRKTNQLFVSQAFSDLLIGLIAMPLALLIYAGKIAQHHTCVFTISSIIFLRVVGNNNIIAISLDRYKALSNPIGYATNKSNLKITVTLIWVIGFVVGFGVIFRNHEGDGDPFYFETTITEDYLIILQFFFVFIPLTVLSALYASVYWMLRKHYMRHSCEHCRTNVEGCKRDLCKIRKRESHATINMLFIVASFAVCKLPLLSMDFIQIFKQISLSRDVLEAFVAVNNLNSMLNPILYAFHLKDFRKSSMKMLNMSTSDEIDSTSNRNSQAKRQNSAV